RPAHRQAAVPEGVAMVGRAGLFSVALGVAPLAHAASTDAVSSYNTDVVVNADGSADLVHTIVAQAGGTSTETGITLAVDPDYRDLRGKQIRILPESVS